jgi:hypothetical protein
MPIDFPDDPSVGEQFTAGGQTWVWTGSVWSAYRGGPVVQYGNTAPENAVDGLIWFNTSNNTTNVYIDGEWIDTTNTTAVATTVVDDSDGDALTITQEGTGRALVVNGSTSVSGTLNATTLQQNGSGVALSSELTGHTSATTTVHGISDTANLVYTADARLSDARTPTAHASSHGSAGSDPVTLAQSQVTNLTTDLGNKASASDLTGHISATTSVHGITNTADLVVTTDARLSDNRTPTDGSVTDAKIVAGGLSTTAITGTAVVTGDSRLSDQRTPLDNSVTSAKIVDGTIVNADISTSAAVAFSKLENGSALSVLGRSANTAGANASIAAATDGHVLRRSGTAVGFGTIATAGIADSAVTSAKIADGTIVNADVSSTAAIAQSKVSGLTTDLAAKADKSAGYQYHSTIYITSNGNFEKAAALKLDSVAPSPEATPWLRAIRVRLVGGGGAGGGASATTSTQGAAGAGGGAGGYAERFYTNISALSASVSVTIGSGGTGSAGASGGGGGTTEFGGAGDAWRVRASGGGGAGWNLGSTAGGTLRQGSSAGSGSNGDLLLTGGPGQMMIVFVISAFNSLSGNGGNSFFAGGGHGAAPNIDSGSNGVNGSRGSGGSGAINLGTQASARAGGNGGAGIVIVELFA